MNNQTAIVPGSLAAVAASTGLSLAETFLDSKNLALIDISSSMLHNDSRGGRQRSDVANEELINLQRELPGKIGVVAFSSDPIFVPGGVIPTPYGGTNLARALRYVKIADGTVHFYVISDGLPDSEEAAMEVARTFTSPISTIFCGPETDLRGQAFLQRLAKVAGGKYTLAARAVQLADRIKPLMLNSG